ncbi:saccharopine dehydrogenase [Candidatus Tenderia electrophaga]|jgi:saccharopine dehydrogenase-like NADP-dependent oxidoreductase|uniref:Saccharopine dehydrogenase n=1 Tax=Candidatus Tenderia electrophaga TaxID=1748243 RepID=A0A0S2TGJ9_9GAMM|nr:saccharopine dehydrogenase [Candidatus Tenderia electrophaga]
MKRQVLLLGAGKIGSLITCILAESGDYDVHVGSLNTDAAKQLCQETGLCDVKAFLLDARDESALAAAMQQHKYDAVISGLPYYCNPLVADLAARYDLNYFDLTEDVEVTRHVQKVSAGRQTIFMPQCGLAPGFISIAANELMQHFDELEVVKMRVGALPVNPSNVLKYSLTWSTDGLINEYGNTCYGIEEGELAALQPLEGYETITLDGVLYEAFNTSGGLGTLAESYDGKIRHMNYKTMRYPGHCDQIKLLMNDLRLNDDRDTLKRILENAIPKTQQDVVLIYVAVAGRIKGELMEENYVKKVYPQDIAGKRWSSIQVTTAAGICSAMDIVLDDRDRFHGFVTQERIALDDVINNRFGKYYA